jgi:tryptophanyl-tRNA synthetase
MDRVFSGIQPTGTLHLGNYLGAVSNWVRLQDRADIERVYCVVDYHAITADYDPRELGPRTLALARDLLACGVDPDRSAVFVQSQVPEHTELAWILASCASYGDLQRMTQFKSKGEHQSFVSSGLFTYPVLQAADILLYDADLVPVGEDQVQHLELTRDIARRFNLLYGECFPEVNPLLTESPRIMSLRDPEQKMSKSAGEGHFLALDAPENENLRMIKRAVTDVGPAPEGRMSAGVANLFTILKALGEASAHAGLVADYERGELRYAALKEAVAEAVLDLVRGFQSRKAAIPPERARAVLQDGAERVRPLARAKLADVRRRIGLADL